MRLIRPLVTFLVCAALATSPSASHDPVDGAEKPSAIPANPDRATVLHLLNRIGYGPRPGDLERVSEIGLAKYIDQQLHPDRLADAGMAARLSGFDTLAMSTRELADRYFIPAMMERRERQRQRAATDATSKQPSPDATSQRAEPQNPEMPAAPEMRREQATGAMREEREALAELGQQRILRAVYSERQLNEVLVDFWFNHFNVFAGKGADRIYLMEYERDVIRPHVLGRFRDLLGAVAESPAMLFYLDNWMSADPKMAEKTAQAQARFGMGPPRPHPSFDSAQSKPSDRAQRKLRA